MAAASTPTAPERALPRVGADGPLARVVFTLLVIGCFGAFFLTQRLKHTPTIVQHFQLSRVFSPTNVGQHMLERISFRIKRADRATVTVVDDAGNDVATLTRAQPLARYVQYRLRWNGATDAGRPAPAGFYRVRVRLQDQARSVLSPRRFELKVPPGASLAVSPGTSPAWRATPTPARAARPAGA